MTGDGWIAGRLSRVAALPLGQRAWVLCAAVAAAWLVALPLAAGHAGSAGITASAWAAAACLAGSLLALWISERSRRGDFLLGWLAGMGARTGVPLAWALAVQGQWPGLAGTGTVYYSLIAFFLVALTTETFLSLPRQAPPSRGLKHG
ncbi:MAG: hypothetical protein WD278_05305 [Pirellulales bacterium]